MKNLKYFLILLFVCLCLTGCGNANGRITISGNVTFDSKPLESGSIQFFPANDNGITAGGNIKSGKFTTFIKSGKYVVQITANRKTGKKIKSINEGLPDEDELEQYIPEKYNTNSTLTVEVGDQNNPFNFELKSAE
ncbi:MAG: hypothetical protein LBT09_09320 [Planctomycetaceae bacterium]|jgi:hypothetical protein|nr:hypothetical protein [Planctomycetaceae bacterium]